MRRFAYLPRFYKEVRKDFRAAWRRKLMNRQLRRLGKQWLKTGREEHPVISWPREWYT